MKRILPFFVLCAVMASCTPKSEITLMSAENFNTTVDGKAVTLYTLKNADLTMQVTNFGARVVSLWTPDRNGDFEDIVL